MGREATAASAPLGISSDNTTAGRGATCSIGGAPALLIVQPGVTCCLISAAYNLTTQQLLTQNPGLDCSALSPGQVVKQYQSFLQLRCCVHCHQQLQNF